MHAFATLAVLLCLGPTLQGGPWRPVQSVEATGYERVLGGARHTFTARRSGGLLAFHAARAIDGQLADLERVEVVGPKGVFTWLKSQPGWALQLPGATLGDLAKTVKPAPYTPDDVLADRERVQRLIGMPVSLRGEDTSAGRPSYVVILGSPTAANAAARKVWLDKQTGVTLRQLDTAGSSEDYELQVTSLEPGAPLAAAGFAPGARTRVVRGAVAPESLRALGELKVWSDYTADADALRQSAAGVWIRRLPDPSAAAVLRTFSYANTVSRGIEGAAPTGTTEMTRIGYAAGKPVMMAGQLPAGYRLSVDSANDAGELTLALTTPSGAGPKITVRATPSSSGQSTRITSVVSTGDTGLTVSLRTDANGALVVEPRLNQGPAGRGGPPAPPFGPRGAGARRVAPAWTQADFVDRRSGDSLTFLQARGRPVIPLLDRFGLPPATTADDPQLGRVLTYQVTKPFALTVVAWATPEAQYALASTRLSAGELRQLAKQIAATGR